jgi:hypothetical protein
MSYSEHVAKVVADQLERFVTLNRHQLDGHVANLDFWIAEARHALEVIDGYPERFRRQKDRQTEQKTKVPSPFDPDVTSLPGPPRRLPDASLRNARRSVVDATYRFLMRLCNDGLIPEARLRSICSDLMIGVDLADLRRARLPGHGT